MNSLQIKRAKFYALIVIFLCTMCPLGDAQQGVAREPNAQQPKWILTWSDEFNAPNGTAPDPTKWIIETGGKWANNELQAYTARPKNVRLDDGNLIIEAFKEKFSAEGIRREYTSARMTTAGRFNQRYGRFEARIKLPSGQGLWPAFWMLGSDLRTAGWPACGEIDIMENIGSEPSKNNGSLHGPGYSGKHSVTAVFTLPSGRFSDAFHVFAVEWEPEAIRFFVDDENYVTRTLADLGPGKRWVYDHPFFIILNVAVGGNMPGSPDRTTVFPQRMLVDYVRVYSRK